MTRAANPYDGIRVLDLTDETAAFGPRLLADLGAEVLRIEPPQGSRLRRLAPFLDDEPGAERSLPHLYLDAGKKSVVVDRTSADGQATFRALMASADAVIETERLDHDELRAINPHLVHVTATPFGLTGSWSDRRGNDLVTSAASGLPYICGSPGDPPSQPGGDQAAKLTGMAVASAVAIALAGREQSPDRAGVHLEVSMQEAAAAAALQTAHPVHWLWQHHIPKRPGQAAVHRCADDKWTTVVVRPERVSRFVPWAREAGLDIDDETEQQMAGPRSAQVLHPYLRELAGRYPRDEFLERVWALDLMGLPVNSLPDLGTCDHLVANQQFVEVDDDARGRTWSLPHSPVNVLPGVAVRRAPLLGEHTSSVDLPAVARGGAPTGDLDIAHALDGIRVLDFCWVIAGPLGTRMLANFGAEVIRVESGSRALPEVWPKGDRDLSLGAFHNWLNTQKRSTTIDPRTPRGRELLLQLVEQVDIVTSNYRPGAIEAMGFGYDVLREINPKVISLQVPGCGSKGPWATRTSFGNMVAAAAGINAVTGFPGRAPRGMGVAYPDFTSPYFMVLVLLGALRQRAQTGEGMALELNQLAATVSLVGVEWMQFATSGVEPPMRGNRDPNWCPHGIYPTTGDDQWVALAVESDEEFAVVADVLGSPSLAADPRFATHADRKANEDALDDLIREWSSTQDKWKAAEVLQSRGLAAAAVADVRDVVENDPQLAHFFERVTQPTRPDVEIPIPGEVIQPAGRRRPLRAAPTYGGDNDYVLRDLLGLDGDEIDALRAGGVIS